ncbi:MAG: hypothetical protein HY471_02095 [Candidatus Sungbacteria bacterium]|nr:hypothetical protein [Candidatus Sungbacteria bacterium]
MRTDKVQALKYRLSGKSYNEITNLVGVPKGTLSDWFSKLELSDQARTRIKKRVYEGALRGLIKRNKHQTHLAIQRMREGRVQGESEIGSLGIENIKLIGIALYWAEGYKRALVKNGRTLTHHPVSLTNSDPNLVAMFLRFLREVCLVSDEKIKADIRIYEHINTQAVVNFWQKVTGLPHRNFGKVYYGISKSSLDKRPFTRLPYGTILIRVNSTALFHKIMGWIKGVAKQAAMV